MNNTKIKITTCDSGDWEILEIDGKLWTSGHHIDNHVWLELLRLHFGCEIVEECLSDEEMESIS